MHDATVRPHLELAIPALHHAREVALPINSTSSDSKIAGQQAGD